MGINIAHFSIGEPYARLGGLVSYVESLIESQQKDCLFDHIHVLFPYYLTFFPSKSRVKVIKRLGKITFAGIVNSNPESLLEGIKYPESSISNESIEKALLAYLFTHNIQIVHFHSFLGITSNTVKLIHEKGIKTIYTTHDYQPVCPKINLIDNSGIKCYNVLNGDNCAKCNISSLSRGKLAIRNNRLGLFLQSFKSIKSLGKKVLRLGLTNKRSDQILEKHTTNDNAEYYKKRSLSFLQMLNTHIDLIHFNSQLTRLVYNKVGVRQQGIVLPVSNKNFTNEIEFFEIKLSPKKLRFGFLGGNRREKGANELLTVFKGLVQDGYSNFELKIFGEDSRQINIPHELEHYVFNHGYSKENTYNKFDILIIPSIWNETFGFVVAEALMHKKGVIASKSVGAITYLNGTSLTFESFFELKEILVHILQNGASFVYSGGLNDISFDNHYKKMREIYQDITKQ